MNDQRRDDDVSLRAHLEALLRAESARNDARFVEYDKALIIRTHEIERRLEALNGEQARLLSDRERFLPKEVFDPFKDTVTEKLNHLEGRDSGLRLAWTVGIAIAGIAVAVAIAIFSRISS